MTLNREQWAIEWQHLWDVDWRDLDVKEAGGWPWLLKVLCCCLALLAALSVMLWLVVSEQREALMVAQRQEARLLSEYRSKASQAAFLPEMRDQLATLEGRWGACVPCSLPMQKSPRCWIALAMPPPITA